MEAEGPSGTAAGQENVVENEGWWKKQLDQLEEPEGDQDLAFEEREFEEAEQPAQMVTELLPFQKESLTWMLKQERSAFRGGINADDMGMGKTIQAIALIVASKFSPEGEDDAVDSSLAPRQYIGEGCMKLAEEAEKKAEKERKLAAKAEAAAAKQLARDMKILEKELLKEEKAAAKAAAKKGGAAAGSAAAAGQAGSSVATPSAAAGGAASSSATSSSSAASSSAASSSAASSSSAAPAPPAAGMATGSTTSSFDTAAKAALASWQPLMEDKSLLDNLAPGPRSGATLVVCPKTALTQWRSEIFKHTAPGTLRVYSYHETARNISPEELQEYDVVLTTYGSLEVEYRAMVEPGKVTCQYCSKKFLPEKLAIHLRYFCGPDAQKTAAQAKQMRTREGGGGGGGGGGADAMEEEGQDIAPPSSESDSDSEDGKASSKKKKGKQAGKGAAAASTPAGSKKRSKKEGAAASSSSSSSAAAAGPSSVKKQRSDDGAPVATASAGGAGAGGSAVINLADSSAPSDATDGEGDTVGASASGRGSSRGRGRGRGRGGSTSRSSPSRSSKTATATAGSSSKKRARAARSDDDDTTEDEAAASSGSDSASATSSSASGSAGFSSEEDEDEGFSRKKKGRASSTGSWGRKQAATPASSKKRAASAGSARKGSTASGSKKAASKGRKKKKSASSDTESEAASSDDSDAQSEASADSNASTEDEARPAVKRKSRAAGTAAAGGAGGAATDGETPKKASKTRVQKLGAIALLQKIHWKRVILDEAHVIKNKRSSTAKAAFCLTAERRWCLSGTPLQNRVGELFSLLRFLRLKPYASYFCKNCPCSSLEYRFDEGGRECELCGHSPLRHYHWMNRYVLNPIKRFGYTGPGRDAMLVLRREVLDGILLRRTKQGRAADLTLPGRVVQIRNDIELDQEEKDYYTALYQQSKAQFSAFVEKGTLLNNFAHLFDLLTRLRQAVNHPYLVQYGRTLSAAAAAAPAASASAAGGAAGSGSSSLVPVSVAGLLEDEGPSATGICGICREDLTDPVVTGCKHFFCRSCMRDYLQSLGDATTAASLSIMRDRTNDESAVIQDVPAALLRGERAEAAEEGLEEEEAEEGGGGGKAKKGRGRKAADSPAPSAAGAAGGAGSGKRGSSASGRGRKAKAPVPAVSGIPVMEDIDLEAMLQEEEEREQKEMQGMQQCGASSKGKKKAGTAAAAATALTSSAKKAAGGAAGGSGGVQSSKRKLAFDPSATASTFTLDYQEEEEEEEVGASAAAAGAGNADDAMEEEDEMAKAIAMSLGASIAGASSSSSSNAGGSSSSSAEKGGKAKSSSKAKGKAAAASTSSSAEIASTSAAASADLCPNCPTCFAPLTVDLLAPAEAAGAAMLQAKKKSILHRLPQGRTGKFFRSSSKIEALLEDLWRTQQEEPGAKCLIFSQFTSFLDLMEHRLSSAGIRVVKMEGSMSIAARDRVIDSFRNDAFVTAFLISMKAGGVALNLTTASRCYLMDLWWNPAAESQAADRTLRIGQHRTVTVVRFVVRDSVEEKILALQEKKRLVFDATVGQDSAAMGKLTEDDMRFLFSG